MRGKREVRKAVVPGSGDDVIFASQLVEELISRRMFPVSVELHNLDGTWVKWTFATRVELESARPIFRKLGAMLRVRYKRE